jgi:DTW domain-containing protein YfiP
MKVYPLSPLWILFLIVYVCATVVSAYEPHLRAKIASSITKGERRAQERATNSRRELCGHCRRPPVQCVCSSLPTQELSQLQTEVLILQHPAEFRRKTFSTVPLIRLVLERVQICVGHCL